MLEYCNKKVHNISRWTLGHDIRSLYDILFQQIYTKLQDHCNTGGKISITLDAWSSITRILFLGITGHYIEKRSNQFPSILLGFERLRGSHTADSLSRVCLIVLQGFQLTNHIRAVTSDNATTNTKMLHILEQSLPGFNAKGNHIRCMAHIINWAVQELLSHLRVTASDIQSNNTSTSSTITLRPSIDPIFQVFGKARAIIRKVHASNLLWESFEAQSKAAKLPPLKLMLDMPIR